MKILNFSNIKITLFKSKVMDVPYLWKYNQGFVFAMFGTCMEMPTSLD
jgi:hypothetical protein